MPYGCCWQLQISRKWLIRFIWNWIDNTDKFAGKFRGSLNQSSLLYFIPVWVELITINFLTIVFTVYPSNQVSNRTLITRFTFELMPSLRLCKKLTLYFVPTFSKNKFLLYKDKHSNLDWERLNSFYFLINTKKWLVINGQV